MIFGLSLYFAYECGAIFDVREEYRLESGKDEGKLREKMKRNGEIALEAEE